MTKKSSQNLKKCNLSQKLNDYKYWKNFRKKFITHVPFSLMRELLTIK